MADAKWTFVPNSKWVFDVGVALTAGVPVGWALARARLPRLLATATTKTAAELMGLERELGTLEQLVATPIRKTELMLGKILPYVVLGYADITLALIIGALLLIVAGGSTGAAERRAES